MKKNIFNYFLFDKQYDGEIYIKSDDTQKYGFTCFADSEYKYKLDIREIDKSHVRTYKNNDIYKHYTYMIFFLSFFYIIYN